MVYAETVTVTGNGTYTTPTGYTLPTSGTAIGTYQWVASYSGDPNNNAVTSPMGTAPVSVTAASPTIVTLAIPATGVAVGQELRDSETISGGYYPSGTITFTLYASDHVTAVYTEEVGASGNGTVSTTNGWVPTTTGTYYWTASYSGDANNASVTSGAGDEPVNVNGWSAYVSTVIVNTNHVPVVSPYRLGQDRTASKRQAGATVLDTVTVTGDEGESTPTGTITYTFTGTNSTSLAGLAVPAGWTVSADRLSWSETVTMSGGKVPDSSPAKALPPGSYVFVAQYSGDAQYLPSTSDPEPLTIKGHTGGIIEPPHTTCTQVRRDIAQGDVGQSKVKVHVTASGGNIAHHVTPPFFTYYVRLFAPSSSFQVNVGQSSPYPLPPFAALNGHVTLHNAIAQLIALPRGSVTETSNDVKIKLNKLTPGSDYYVAIRYSTRNLVGKTWPFGRNATVDDVFKTTSSEGGLVPASTVKLPIVDSTPVITTTALPA